MIVVFVSGPVVFLGLRERSRAPKIAQNFFKNHSITVESRYNGRARIGNPSITEAIIKSHEFFSLFSILAITEIHLYQIKMVGHLKSVKAGVNMQNHNGICN